MKIKTYEIKDKSILPKSLAEIFHADEYCVVDIETTGLSRQYHQVILIGILYNMNGTIILKQFFAEHPKEEINVLREFSNTFKNFSYIITYNGQAFDIPFLKARFHSHNLNWSFDHIKHIDILQCIKKERQQLPLENFKLKTVEKFLGINRRDTISGKDSVLLYKEYVRHPSTSLERTILLHNYEDIYYLNQLLPIFDRIYINKFDLVGKTISVNHSSKEINFTFYPKDLSIKKKVLYVEGTSEKFEDEFDFIYFKPSLNFEWFPKEGKFNIRLQLYEGYLSTKEKCNYIDLEELTLSKALFKQSKHFDERLFPNNFMVLRVEKDMNFYLIGDLIKHLLNKIFS